LSGAAIAPVLDGVSVWVGSDESGKGDYFGPLVTAAVAVTSQNWRVLETLAAVLLVIAGCDPPESSSRSSGSSGSSSTTTSKAVVKITASDDVCWSGRIGRTEKSGCGSVTVRNVKGSDGVYTVKLRKTKGSGGVTVKLIVGGKTVDSSVVVSQSSVVTVDNRR
jgi:hypothetical protein